MGRGEDEEGKIRREEKEIEKEGDLEVVIEGKVEKIEREIKELIDIKKVGIGD